MNASTLQTLCELDDRFYRENAASFSQTRTAPWQGWKQLLPFVQDTLTEHGECAVLDLACGNLRFEAFLQERFPTTRFTFHAVDNCDELVGQAVPVDHKNIDILGALRGNRAFSEEIGVSACNLSVAFGFMHHVPTRALREQVLSALVDCTCSGGYVAVSFWRFMDDAGLAKKACAVKEQALREVGLRSEDLDEGDYLLGWKNLPGTYRYCHSFSDGEIDGLARVLSPRAQKIACFPADGRTNALNSYLVMQVR